MSLKHSEIKNQSMPTTPIHGIENNDDDECDSSLLLHSSRKPIQFTAESQSDTNSLVKISPFSKNATTAPPMVTQKAASTVPSVRPVQVRPVVRPTVSTHKSPNRHRIDKIADTLKINIMQKESNPAAAPKVSVVTTTTTAHAIKLRESPGKLNQVTRPAVAIDRKKLVHSIHNFILKNHEVKLREKENEKEDDDGSLTNLSWLSKFNLASTGLRPLSPPQTPPRQLAQVKVPPAIKLASPHLSRPILNPLIKKSVPSLNLANDEADGCHVVVRRPPQTQAAMIKNIDMTSVIKRLLPEHANNSHQRPPYSFSTLTLMAIESSARKRLSVKEIYTWVTDNLPYYRSVPSGSWKNSIRYNLSFNRCFCKVDKNLLAMRDFSGKGSLWCVSPEFRTGLYEELVRAGSSSPGHLATVVLLQDVNETPRATISNPAVASTSGDDSSSPVKSCAESARMTNSAYKKLNASQKLIGNKITANKTSGAILNPRLVNMGTTKQPNPFLKLNTLFEKSLVKGQPVNNNSSGELDAVKALLSMKSRSSSMPGGSSFANSAAAQKQIQQHQRLLLNESKILSQLDLSRSSRRKQVFKPPTKNTMVTIEDDTDEENMNESFDYLCQESESEESAVVAPALDSKRTKQVNESITTKANAVVANNKKSKKLLVKFSCFKTNKTRPETTVEEDMNMESDDDEKSLKIDESFTEEPAEEKPVPSRASKRKLAQTVSQLTHKAKMQKSLDKAHNLLLELSRAASVVEDD